MSGGEWGYQSLNIEDQAEKFATFMKAVAESEQIVDWAVSCDTSREEAEHKLYDLWLKTFNEVYG